MSEQRKKILEMLSSGTITADEANRLLGALEKNNTVHETYNSESVKKGKPKFLHVKVEKETYAGNRHKDVDIKIPIMLLKAGMKLGSMIPESSKDELNSHLNGKGIHLDLNSIDAKDIDAIMSALAESSIDINTDKEKVKIYCE